MSVPGLLVQQLLANPDVRLPELNTRGFRQVNQSLPGTTERAGVSRVADVLLLHGRINIHSGQLGQFDQFQPETSGNRFLQHFFSASVTNTCAPSGHAARINRQVVLEELSAREILQ